MMKYKWQVGDRFFDPEFPLAGIGEILEMDEYNLTVAFENEKKGYGAVGIDDPNLVPEEVYNTPLYKALREEK